MSPKTVRLSGHDNVAVLIGAGDAQSKIDDLVLTGPVPAGHKVALTAIKRGDPILKYGQIIGIATDDIPAGTHVHTHNCGFPADTPWRALDNGDHTDAPAPGTVADTAATFSGFLRPDGKVGTRNYIAVISTVNCSATVVREIARHFGPRDLEKFPSVDGVIALVHGTGCGMADTGEGFGALQRVLCGYARHPNIAGVLLIGLGCEVAQADMMAAAFGLPDDARMSYLNIQSAGGTNRTIKEGILRVNAMLPVVNSAVRTLFPARHLTVALQCGGSDAWSGISANPALGYAADLIVAQGGKVILSETPEIYGAEHLLMRRAQLPEVGDALMDKIRWWESYTQRNGGTIDNNPSPGNKAGGLTTILEKSLGAAAKGGTSPLVDVVDYAAPVTRPGLTFMDSPGYDPVSVTGQIASGATVVCFTTGRGSAFGSKPSPCLKLATNSQTFTCMSDDMDIDCGAILTGKEAIAQAGQRIFDAMLALASGEKSKSEALGYGDAEFTPWQLGAVM